MNEIIQKDLNDFKSFLDQRNLDFMVVGSLALLICGLEVEVHDIDMEIVCKNSKDEEVFKILSDSQKNDFYKLKNEYDSFDRKPYIFRFGKSIINVWVYEEFTHKTFVYKDYIKYAGVMDVLRKKISYKRYKDVNFVLNLFKNILNIYDKS